jgi:hypothetical protein
MLILLTGLFRPEIGAAMISSYGVVQPNGFDFAGANASNSIDRERLGVPPEPNLL